MLVLLCVALCICLVHLFQFKPVEARSTEAAKVSFKKIVWLSGLAPAGFYLIPAAGLPLKDIYASLGLPLRNSPKDVNKIFLASGESYNLTPAGISLNSRIPAGAAPFFYLPISLNKADRELLATLPGIGAKLAQNIVDYRARFGGFTGVEEIMKVDGVGEKKFQRIKKLLSL